MYDLFGVLFLRWVDVCQLLFLGRRRCEALLGTRGRGERGGGGGGRTVQRTRTRRWRWGGGRIL